MKTALKPAVPADSSANAAAPTGFSATKRVGYVLNATGEGLSWLEANDVLLELGKQHKNISNAHRDLVLKNPMLKNARMIDPEEEAKEHFVAVDQNGHLFRSSTITASFAPHPESDPSYQPFTLSLFLAYTVCVQLIPPDGDETPRNLHSKFWYNIIVEPKDDSTGGENFPENFEILSSKMDSLSSEIFDATIGLYSLAVNEVKTVVFDGKREEIGDCCVQFPDILFADQSWGLEHGEFGLPKAKGSSFSFLRDIYQQSKKNGNTDFLLNVDGNGIDTEVIVQRDFRGAKAFYIVTSDNVSYPARQKALGVTSEFQPNKPVVMGNLRSLQKAQHAHSSNSISAARVAIVAGSL